MQAATQRDIATLWHPCTPMKIHEKLPLLPVTSAQGCYYHLEDGRRIFDATSSWWCKSLGHGHPRLRAALIRQMNQFEHVMMAGTTSLVLVELSERLTQLTPLLSKVFYAGDGSSAVEVALKMSLHYRKRTGEQHRQRFLCLENAYHGETVGAMSVSDLGLYRAPYENLLMDVDVLDNLPYVQGENDPLWLDAQAHFEAKLPYLNALSEKLTAIIFEPVIQGAGGMKIISADFLARLMDWAKQNNIHIILDEIMTGFGRTGKMFACEHLNKQPDFLCVSKGMTSGWLAMSAVLTTNAVYDVLYTDRAEEAFLHSHTYSGNALAAAVALETIKVFQEEKIVNHAAKIGERMLQQFNEINDQLNCFENVRGLGAMVAAEIVDCPPDFKTSVMALSPRYGAYLRPLGNTLYWLPPLIASDADLEILSQATQLTLADVLQGKSTCHQTSF